jgi:hypothetical protein
MSHQVSPKNSGLKVPQEAKKLTETTSLDGFISRINHKEQA